MAADTAPRAGAPGPKRDWWAQEFGTPNYAAHGGFCSVNMAADALYTIGGSFWDFGEPDWEITPEEPLAAIWFRAV